MMTLQKQPDFSKILKALLIGLLVLCLFSCKSKQKTVTRKAETVSELEQKDIIESEISTENNIIEQQEENFFQHEKKDTISEQKTELEARLTPKDTTKPSSATINGKNYTWQNADLTLTEKQSQTNTGSEEKIKGSNSVNTTLENNKKKQKNLSDKSKKEIDKSSSEMNKNKSKSGFNWWWLLLLVIPVAAYFIYKKRKSIITKFIP